MGLLQENRVNISFPIKGSRNPSFLGNGFTTGMFVRDVLQEMAVAILAFLEMGLLLKISKMSIKNIKKVAILAFLEMGLLRVQPIQRSTTNPTSQS